MAAAIGIKRPAGHAFARVRLGSLRFAAHLICLLQEGIQLLRIMLTAVHDDMDRKRYAGFGTPSVKRY